jgi:LPS O-antigen subunit length determinant protein (WzzB/FepE family)
MEANLPSTFDIYRLIEQMFTAMTWVAIIVCSFLILSYLNGNDDDPDGLT